jgi:Na+-driven multidrug efflux pump
MIFAGILAAGFFFFGRQLAWLYTRDAAVIAQTALALRIYAPAQPAQSIRFVLAGALRGAGDTRWPLYATAVGVWGFRVLLAATLIQGLGWGLAGAWVAIATDQVARAWVIARRFNAGRWKVVRV